MAFTPIAVANTLLDIATSRGIKDLTPMKIQKLVYYAHGWWLGVKGKPLIDEQVEAWPYGPVVPSVFDAVKKYGNTPITRYLVTSYEDAFDIAPQKVPEYASEDVRNLLDWIVDQYGRHTGITLSNLTHLPGTPWEQVNRKYNGRIPKCTDIPSEVIEEFFRNEAQELVGITAPISLP